MKLIRRACATLRENHPNTTIHDCSMTDLDVSSFRGRIDLLAGGVHCQSFSQAGIRKGL